MRQRLPATKIDAVKIRRHRLSPILRGGLRDLRERTKDREPGVVDQHVQFPERCDRVPHEALYVLLVRDISRANKRFRCIEACDGFAQLMFTPSIQNDERALLEKTTCCAGPDSRTGARDDDYFTFESVHDLSDDRP